MAGTSHIPKAMRRLLGAGALLAAALPALSSPARADLQLCNRMSFVVEAAIGVETGSAATRGWFRIDPGQCRTVLQGAIDAEKFYVHARALAVYGGSPLPQQGHTDLCIAPADFVIAAARNCRSGQKLTRFTEVKPGQQGANAAAYLAEENEYDDEQARLAAVQRLLTIAGYDATPIDGVDGPKTAAALAQFLRDKKLPAEASSGSAFFDALIDAAQKPEGTGFVWCNDTSYSVMAALGVEEKSGIVTRGWYRVEPKKCLRPDVFGKPARLYSFAEAVDAAGKPVALRGTKLQWGGDKTLCTRESKFEIAEQSNCAAQGLSASPFAMVDTSGRSTTVRFTAP